MKRDLFGCSYANRLTVLVLSAVISVLPSIGSRSAVSAEKSAQEQVDALVMRMNAAASPRSALLMLDELEASVELNATLKSRVATQRARFEELLANEQAKVAGRWVSPADLRAAVEASDAKIVSGFQAITAGDGVAALAAFEAAVKAYPEGIRARFLMGMAFSAKGNFHPKKAAQYFESVVDRSPNHWPAVNNLALTQFRMGNHANAYSLWKRLLEAEPEFPEAVHNVRRVVREVGEGRIRFTGTSQTTRSTTSRSDLFQKLADSLPEKSRSGQPLYQLGMGWRYAPLIESATERRDVEDAPEMPQRDAALKSEDAIAGTGGTGVIIQKNLILTSRSVVEDDVLGRASQVMVDKAQDGNIQSYLGRVLEISERDDLALVEVALDEDAAGIPLAGELIPETSVQIVTAGPRYVLDGKLVSSAAVLKTLPEVPDRGLATFSTTGEFTVGAPLLNAQNQLLGLSGSRYLGQIVVDRHKAIPVDRIRNWLASLDQLPAGDVSRPPEAADSTHGVVRLTGLYPSSHLGLRDVLPPEMRHARSEYEDPSCVNCNGLTFVRCTARGCSLGAVTSIENSPSLLVTPNNGTFVIPGSAARQSKCQSCNGKGRLACSVCRGKGINPDIR